MPLNLTHNHFGDYTPLSRTPSTFKGLTRVVSQNLRLGLDELGDRPHFGVEDIKTQRSHASIPVQGGLGNHFYD